MRIGINPQKNRKVNLGDYFHQVIVPIYIPCLEGYYKESFEVFKLSIQSLIKTSHPQTYISVISNGSCKQVNDYIIDLHNQHEIQDFAIVKEIGKVNSILKGLSGIHLPLVTVSDADVLFLNGWQKASYKVFNHFPKTGVVSPVPNPSLCYYKTGNVFRDNLFSKNIKYSKIKNVEAVLNFARSINNLALFKEKYSEKYVTISDADFKAVIGAGHFVATYKAQIFDFDFKRSTDFLLGGDSVNTMIDIKTVYSGLWRLSTEDNYAYHLGNTVQPWVTEVYDNLYDEIDSINSPQNLNVRPLSFFREKYEILSNKIFNSYKFREIVLRRIIK